MTEIGWVRSNKPLVMLNSLARSRSPRKYRLLACAVARAEWMDGATTPIDEKRLRVIELAEQIAEGAWPPGIPERPPYFWPEINGLIANEAYESARWALWDPGDSVPRRTSRTDHSDLIRDIFGNPFRPVAFDPQWRTSTAVAIAQGMYESREFSAMPILADALQDAGCEDEVVLNHCRDAGSVHVRGCWVVDLVLGKA